MYHEVYADVVDYIENLSNYEGDRTKPLRIEGFSVFPGNPPKYENVCIGIESYGISRGE